MNYNCNTPTLGRFNSEDPIGFLGGQLNLCAYVMSAIEGSYASGHLYQPWTGVQSAAHKTGDQVIIPAAEAAARAFLTALWKNKPLGKAEDYLAPRPANCR